MYLYGQVREQSGHAAAVSRDVTERVVQAVARLAQDGSQEARNFAKLTLAVFLEQCPDDAERVLRKHLSESHMRNVEKILDALRQQQGGNGSAFGGRGVAGRARRRSRKGIGRKTL